MKRIILILLALVLTFSCASCAVKVQAKELSAGYRRGDGVGGEVTEEFRDAMADVSMELFRRVAAEGEGNTVFSPLSAVLCLGLIANGAQGNTLAQLEDLLGLSLDALNPALYAYTGKLMADGDCKWRVANSVWYREDGGLQVKESFLQKNADFYSAKAYLAPFDQTTVEDINTWCKENTDGMIGEILKEIPEDAMLYLINALCFEAAWEEEYLEEQIHSGIFYNLDGTETRLDMLHSSESVYLENESLTGFAKDYAGGNFSFVGLLPKEGLDVYGLIDSLSGEDWTQLWDSRHRESVQVTMPEFTGRSSIPLEKLLADMGVTDLFSERADLDAMATYTGGHLYCSRIQQEAFIQVDRSGTKAAAVTWGQITAEGAYEEQRAVILDRPFVYAIVDNATGVPIFVGVTTDLT